jgi:small subunit ribosomal protein S6
MALYDLTLILDAEAPEDRRTEIVEGVRAAIEADGLLRGAHDWGVRRLAYEIDHRGDGDYHLLQFEGSADLLERLDRTLKITDGVLRFRFIRLRPSASDEAPARPEAPRRDEERSGAPAQVAARAAADAPPRGERG